MASELSKKKVVRLSLLARRKEGMSEEEFHRHWTHVHAPLVVEWLARYGTVRYTQVRPFAGAVSWNHLLSLSRVAGIWGDMTGPIRSRGVHTLAASQPAGNHCCNPEAR